MHATRLFAAAVRLASFSCVLSLIVGVAHAEDYPAIGFYISGSCGGKPGFREFYPASNDPSHALPDSRRTAAIGDCIGQIDPLFPTSCTRPNGTVANHGATIVGERVHPSWGLPYMQYRTDCEGQLSNWYNGQIFGPSYAADAERCPWGGTFTLLNAPNDHFMCQGVLAC